jgi:ribosome-binding protein aMBF1 (putative translation factor)
MALQCPACNTVYASTGNLIPICNICGRETDRRTAQLIRYQGDFILVGSECIDKMATQTLDELLNPNTQTQLPVSTNNEEIENDNGNSD